MQNNFLQLIHIQHKTVKNKKKIFDSTVWYPKWSKQTYICVCYSWCCLFFHVCFCMWKEANVDANIFCLLFQDMYFFVCLQVLDSCLVIYRWSIKYSENIANKFLTCKKRSKYMSQQFVNQYVLDLCLLLLHHIRANIKVYALMDRYCLL